MLQNAFVKDDSKIKTIIAREMKRLNVIQANFTSKWAIF